MDANELLGGVDLSAIPDKAPNVDRAVIMLVLDREDPTDDVPGDYEDAKAVAARLKDLAISQGYTDLSTVYLAMSNDNHEDTDEAVLLGDVPDPDPVDPDPEPEGDPA